MSKMWNNLQVQSSNEEMGREAVNLCDSCIWCDKWYEKILGKYVLKRYCIERRIELKEPVTQCDKYDRSPSFLKCKTCGKPLEQPPRYTTLHHGFCSLECKRRYLLWKMSRR